MITGKPILHYLLFVSSILFFTGCQQIEESSTISKELERLSDNNSCQLGFIDQTIDNTSELTIKLNCKIKNEFYPGKILLDVYKTLNEKRIKRDYFSITDVNNKSLGKISQKDVRGILKKEKTFERHFQLLIDGKRDEIKNLIHPKVVKQIDDNHEWFEKLLENMKVRQKGWELAGVSIKEQDSEFYAIFGKEQENEVIIWMSYKFSKKDPFIYDDRIYGIGIIPLK